MQDELKNHGKTDVGRVDFGVKVGLGAYRFGFNGKENDAETGWQDYGFRLYHPKLARFLSVDPLTSSYPWYTPYQFAGNKPIWAIDVDGLEEFIFQYRLENGYATQINKINNKQVQWTAGNRSTRKQVLLDKRTGKPFNKAELGMVQYQYFDADGNQLNIRRNYAGKYVEGANELMEEHNKNYFGSIYIGPDNPVVEVGGNEIPDYRREPQDEVDEAALEHDLGYDAKGAAGVDGALFNQDVRNADEKLLRSSEDTQVGFFQGRKDRKTGSKISAGTYGRAAAVDGAFQTILNIFKRKPEAETPER